MAANENICTTPEELGTWMLQEACSAWFNYDDNDTFSWKVADGVHHIEDPDEEKSLTITATKFFEEHKRLIWNGDMISVEGGAAVRWWDWASKIKGATPDDYDAYSCDFVLQVLLYGKIVYS